LFSLEKEPSIVGNRTRVEILVSILTVAQKGALKTHIMYKANLSHRQLEKYLGFLMDNGMIAKFTDTEYGATFYQVTEKGIEFLKDYAQLSQTYGSEILRAA
jgi:predicted transcriptional regulator